MDSPQKRLDYFIKTMFASKAEFASKLGVLSQTITKYTKEDGSIFATSEMFKKLKTLGLNIDWYLTGDGEMQTIINGPKITQNQGVPYYPLDVTASFIRSFDDINAIPEFYVDFKPLNDCTAYFSVVGDSMYPKYSPGEIIAIKKIKNHDYIQWGETYLVVTSEEANSMRTIKLVHKHRDKKFIILRAANPLYKGDMEVAKEHILEMYIVKGRVKLENL